ncbi:MAG TPA: histidine kinase dimerization/phospho-acceptor domain-containing protein, partial [Geobacteraceae bacterium]
MEAAERKLIHALREQFERLLHGEGAAPLDTVQAKDPEIKALAETLNHFIDRYGDARGFVTELAAGNLEVTPPARNLLASPFKQLHAALQHLTWQACRIADGDYSQRVHFMGDFSTAFNSMVQSLAENERRLHEAYDELEAQSEELLAQNEELARLYEETRVAGDELRKAHDELEARVAERTGELREKDQLLIQQSRMAAMGEMINNIAHQWRQPLNSIGLIMQSLTLLQEAGQLNTENLASMEEQIMELLRHMSRTIDDFRDYFRPDREKVMFHVSNALEKTLSLVKVSLRNRNITTQIVVHEDTVITGYQNEYSQVLLNILQNARDAFEKQEVKTPKITIAVGMEDGRSVVT